MSVSIVIPWRNRGDKHRSRSYEFVLAWWAGEFPLAELISADAGTEPFSSYASSNAGIRAAKGEVLILADADMVPDAGAVSVAIEMTSEPGVVWPFQRAFYLNPDATAKYLLWKLQRPTERDCDFVADQGPGCCLVLSRNTFEFAGGYDERFAGWGFGDTAFAVQAELLAGPGRRLDGDVVHLWHPRDSASFPDSPLFQANAALWRRYREAMDAGPDAVRAVRREAP